MSRSSPHGWVYGVSCNRPPSTQIDLRSAAKKRFLQNQTCGIISHLWFILPPMNDLPHNASGQPPAVLVSAIRKLLRPLVRLMLSHQITYPYLVSMLKSIYVEIADE